LSLLVAALAQACQRPGERAGRAAGCSGSPGGPSAAARVELQDTALGTGLEAGPGRTVTVHYTGMLANGTKFDSSRERGQPLTFKLGQGIVIPGWEQGLAGMRPGGRRRLVVPPALAYGDQGSGPAVPPGATLTFDVELLKVE
jgi:FKBP-type peptidyl-prolyl cis-trans isomerase